MSGLQGDNFKLVETNILEIHVFLLSGKINLPTPYITGILELLNKNITLNLPKHLILQRIGQVLVLNKVASVGQ